jgi:hypothetical protein
MATKTEELKANTERLRVATIKAQEFIAAGGDLASEKGVALGDEMFQAWSAISAEFGHPLLKE